MGTILLPHEVVWKTQIDVHIDRYYIYNPLPFHTVHVSLKARIPKWFAIPFSSHVQMRELDHKESYVPKNWCFWTAVLEKTLENPLDCKEIKLVNLKGNQPWTFVGWNDGEAEAPILCSPDAKGRLIEKNPDAGKYWGEKEEKEVIENEMVGWHHWLNGHEFKQTLGDSEIQGSLACCCPWGRKGSDMTEAT